MLKASDSTALSLDSAFSASTTTYTAAAYTSSVTVIGAITFDTATNFAVIQDSTNSSSSTIYIYPDSLVL